MKEKISLHEFLEQNFCDATSDHLFSLRERLLEAGHIQTISQKYVYSDEAMDMCLEWFEEDLERQDALKSTGSWGKWFEVNARISYAKRRGVPFRISDTKCRPAGVRDMTIRVDGGNYAVELKTGNGAVGYGPDKSSAYEDMQRFFKNNPIICWDFESNGEPLCMKARDLLEALDEYRAGVATWFVYNSNIKKDGTKVNRSCQVNFATSEGKKMEYLKALKHSVKALDWDRMIGWAEFKPEEE